MAAFVALASLGLFLSANSVAGHGLVTNITFDARQPGWNPYMDPYLNPVPARIQRKIDGNGPITTGPAGVVPAGAIFSTSENTEWDYAAKYEATSPTLYADATAGQTVKIEWTPWPTSHLGPIMNYMASCGTTCDGVDGDTLDWFAIQLDNYDYTTGKWPQDGMIQTGYNEVVIPADLAAGKYMFTTIPLAFQVFDEPQYFPRTFQIDLKSSGTVVPKCTGKMPDMFSGTDNQANTYDMYKSPPAVFVFPGPPVYSGEDACPASGSVGSTPTNSTGATSASSMAATLAMASSSSAAVTVTAPITTAPVVASSASTAVASATIELTTDSADEATTAAISAGIATAATSAMAGSASGSTCPAQRTVTVTVTPSAEATSGGAEASHKRAMRRVPFSG